MDEALKRILIPAANPDESDETVWARPMGPDSFVLENIPFAGSWNEGDLVRCAMPAPDSEGVPQVRELIRRSPNRKMFVKFPLRSGSATTLDAGMDEVAKAFMGAAAAYEVFTPGAIAASLPLTENGYEAWVARLRELESKGVRVFVDEEGSAPGG